MIIIFTNRAFKSPILSLIISKKLHYIYSKLNILYEIQGNKGHFKIQCTILYTVLIMNLQLTTQFAQIQHKSKLKSLDEMLGVKRVFIPQCTIRYTVIINPRRQRHRSPKFSIYNFEEGLWMYTSRAHIRRLLAIITVTAIPAFPDNLIILNKDLEFFYILG